MKKNKKSLSNIIDEIRDQNKTDEFCLFITKDVDNFDLNKQNVQATKYFAELDENIVTRVINYNLYKEDINKYLKIKYLPNLLYIKGDEILADLPVYNYSILDK